MIRACGADDVALALPRQKFRKRRFQMIDDKPPDLFVSNHLRALHSASPLVVSSCRRPGILIVVDREF
jgi:hypothetical protein